jgi:cytochrome P450 family 6
MMASPAMEILISLNLVILFGGEQDFESLQSAVYLNAFLNEVLRIDPPINRFDRQCNEDYPLGDTGIIVPKGTLVTVTPFTMHRNPEYFPNPDEFRPERFLPDSTEKFNPLAYMPFGDGPKMCLAIQYAKHKLRYIIVNTVKEFMFRLPDGYDKVFL